jgi:hypothetical protein
VAVNCWVDPAATDGSAGVTAIDTMLAPPPQDMDQAKEMLKETMHKTRIIFIMTSYKCRSYSHIGLQISIFLRCLIVVIARRPQADEAIPRTH